MAAEDEGIVSKDGPGRWQVRWRWIRPGLLSGLALLLTACMSAPSAAGPDVTLRQATPAPTPLVDDGVPLPEVQSAITVDTSNQVVQLARWGKGALGTLMYSPDGRWLAAASTIGLTIFDARTLAQVQTFDIPGNLQAMTFSADGLLAAAFPDGSVLVWRVEDGTVLHTFAGSGGETGASLAFSSDGAVLAISSADEQVQLWRMSDGASVRQLQTHAFSSDHLLFSPDDATLAGVDLGICGPEHCDPLRLQLWGVADGTSLQEITGPIFVGAVAVAPAAGAIVAVVGSGETYRWQIIGDTLEEASNRMLNASNALAITPDGQMVAAADESGRIEVRQSLSGAVLHTLETGRDDIYHIALAPDGKTLVTASRTAALQVGDIASGKLIGAPAEFTDYTMAFALSPDGTIAATGSLDGVVRLWRVPNGTLVRRIVAHTRPIKSLAFSPDGRFIATGADFTVYDPPFETEALRIWDVDDGQPVHNLSGHTHTIESVAFTPDNRTLISSSFDGTLRFWDSSTGQLRQTVEIGWGQQLTILPSGELVAVTMPDGVTLLLRTVDGSLVRTIGKPDDTLFHALAVSPDGSVLAASADDTVRLRRLADGQLLRTFTMSEHVLSLAFSSDGQLLALGGYDNTLQVWGVAEGSSSVTLRGHAERVTGVAFSPNGRLLASASFDATIRWWGVPATSE